MGGYSAFVSTQVFEHITVVRETLEYAYDLLENGGVGLIEVPNGQKVYYEQCYYDIFSDHVNYWSPLSLATLTNECGFEVIQVGETFNRHHLAMFVRKPRKALKKIQAQVEEDERTLQEFISGHERISIWGVGAKARSFIQLIDPNKIAHIWDINAMTWGTYLDSTNVPIVEPNQKEVLDSDLILIFAAAHTDEIISMIKGYGYDGDVIRFDGDIRKVKV